MSHQETDSIGDAADYLFELAKHQGGAAVARVEDGHVILISCDLMRKLVNDADAKGNKDVAIFIKHQENVPS